MHDGRKSTLVFYTMWCVKANHLISHSPFRCDILLYTLMLSYPGIILLYSVYSQHCDRETVPLITYTAILHFLLSKHRSVQAVSLSPLKLLYDPIGVPYRPVITRSIHEPTRIDKVNTVIVMIVSQIRATWND